MLGTVYPDKQWILKRLCQPIATTSVKSRSSRNRSGKQATINIINLKQPQFIHYKYKHITGWWFQSLWKIWKSMGRIIPYTMENNKCLKPPSVVIKSSSLSLLKSSATVPFPTHRQRPPHWSGNAAAVDSPSTWSLTIKLCWRETLPDSNQFQFQDAFSRI